jgi:hypothetical protein
MKLLILWSSSLIDGVECCSNETSQYPLAPELVSGRWHQRIFLKKHFQPETSLSIYAASVISSWHVGSDGGPSWLRGGGRRYPLYCTVSEPSRVPSTTIEYTILGAEWESCFEVARNERRYIFPFVWSRVYSPLFCTLFSVCHAGRRIFTPRYSLLNSQYVV